MYGDNKIILGFCLVIILFCFVKKGYELLIYKSKITNIVLFVQIILGLILFLIFKYSIFTLLILTALIFLSHVFIIDSKDYLIPYSSLIALLIIGIINLFVKNDFIYTNIYDKIIGFIFFLILYGVLSFIQYKIKKDFLGGGDLMLFCVVELFLGSVVTFGGIFIGSFLALIVRMFKKDNKIIPFGPYLSIGFILSLIICNYIFLI